MRLFSRPSSPDSSASKKRRRVLAFALVLPICAAIPALLFQYFLYRDNLAVAKEKLPIATALKKTDRVLVVSPHCDDETLGAGGSMAAARKIGARVQVVFITNGDGSRSTQLVYETRKLRGAGSTPSVGAPNNLFQNIAAMRRREAIAACKELGVEEKDVIFLGYPDGGTRAMWEKNWTNSNAYFSPYTKTSHSPYDFSKTKNAPYSGAQATRDLEKVMRDFAPTVVITTHPADTHPDHWAAFAYASAALERLRLDADSKTRIAATRARISTFLVHHGFWPAPHGYKPNAVLAPPASLVKCGTIWQSEPLSQDMQNAKKSALEKYTSQLVWTPKYLRSFLRRNELFGKVPIAVAQNSTRDRQNSVMFCDSPSDSLWRDRWRAADIQSLNCFSTLGVLQLQTYLAGAASSRVHYQFSVHVITKTEITAWTIDARYDGGKMRATLQSDSDNHDSSKIALNAQLTPTGFSLDMPRATLGVLPAPATLLISASTSVGETRLDQSPTGILRLQ